MPDETPVIEQQTVDRVRIRFAGDSGDGMQLAGSRFTEASAIFGNDLATLPSYPAEIRAPAGSVSIEILTAHFDANSESLGFPGMDFSAF